MALLVAGILAAIRAAQGPPVGLAVYSPDMRSNDGNTNLRQRQPNVRNHAVGNSRKNIVDRQAGSRCLVRCPLLTVVVRPPFTKQTERPTRHVPAAARCPARTVSLATVRHL